MCISLHIGDGDGDLVMVMDGEFSEKGKVIGYNNLQKKKETRIVISRQFAKKKGKKNSEL